MIRIDALLGREYLLYWIVWAAVGSCIGSFLNVVIYRLPRDLSVVGPRSFCPRCEHPIAWHDNIPLFSYAVLRGRCRRCRQPIAWRYPAVELLTAAAAVAVFNRFGVWPYGLVYFALVCALLAASVIDLHFRIIPDEISIYGRWIGLACSFALPLLHGTESRELALGRSLLGAVVGGGWLYATGSAGALMLYGLRWLGVRLRRRPFWRRRLARYRHLKEAMGGGDVKLLAMAGAVIGWKMATVAFVLAPFLALIPGVLMLALKRSHFIPYGPYLSLAIVAAIFFGEDLLAASRVEDTVRLLWDVYLSR